MDFENVKQYLKDRGEPKYRADQIADGYYSGKFKNFLEYSNLSKSLRQELSENFSFLSLIEERLEDSKNSHKVSLKLNDGFLIESVLMEYKAWTTVCLSTQVGCAMGCLFCATGKMGFKRDLTSEEIVDQVIYWQQKGDRIDRIVFMGMGEAFLNWENVYEAIKIIHDRISIGWRKMSVSTVGVVDGINKLTETGLEINLAISLHSTKQDVRQKIMPSASKYQLRDIYEAVRNYTLTTKRQVFFEYTLMEGINDSEADASDLAQFIRSNRLYFLNIISLNPIDDCPLEPSSKDRVVKFLKVLDENSVNYSQRASLGSKIDAACGQLITKPKH